MTARTASDLPPGWRLMTFSSLDSTNAEVKRLIGVGSENAEGLIVQADAQTAGRGRQGRAWASPEGNVYVSFLISSPAKNVAAQIGFVAVVAAMDALMQVGKVRLRCKWPNDVLLEGKKVCGILPELVTDVQGRDWIVLGIGINLKPVQVTDALYPVTSLAEHGIFVSPDSVVRILSQELAHRLEQWRSGGFAPIARAWLAAGPAPGDAISVRLPERSTALEGRFHGLDGDGALMVDVGGVPRRILAGEVLFSHEPVAQARVG